MERSNWGERQTGELIEECCRKNGWKVWFNRVVGRNRLETDAIVATEKAVFVIEIKNLFGEIRPDGFGHWLLRNLKNRLVKVKSGWQQVIYRVDQLKNLFSTSLGRKNNTQILPIVVLNNETCKAESLQNFAANCIIKKSQFEETLQRLNGMVQVKLHLAAVSRVIGRLEAA